MSAHAREDRRGRTRNISLPVLSDRGPQRRLPNVKRWRVACLIGLHLLIAAHLTHWAISGRSVGRFVLSDSMKTLEQGVINPGFLLFAVALLATLLFGRFLCGWACHMGALQDFSAWALRKCGVRVRPFRARLLGYAPLFLALYMFVWPSFKREALIPALRAWWPGALAHVRPVGEFPGFTSAMTSDNLWDGLPGAMLALPFLIACGFATVYFLGGRGLCRYVCPYGGVFRPVDRLSIWRVRVDADRCTRCGLCTAACGSGVSVLDETLANGRITTSACTRSLDCVSACPQGALSFGPAMPALWKGSVRGTAPVGTDMTWIEELLVALAFIVTLLVVRGLYGRFPLLMSAGVAGSFAGVVWGAFRLLRRGDVRVSGVWLRRHGRLRRAGSAMVIASAVGGLFLAHSTFIRAAHWRAGVLDGQVRVAKALVFAPGYTPSVSDLDAARRALRWYSIAGSVFDGGAGLAETPSAEVRRAWLHLVAGERKQAETRLRSALAIEGLNDALVSELASVLLLDGRAGDAEREMTEALARRPAFAQTRLALATLRLRQGRTSEAETLLRAGAGIERRGDTRVRSALASVLLQQGRTHEAEPFLRACVDERPDDVYLRRGLGTARFMQGDVDGALNELHAAIHALRRRADHPADEDAIRALIDEGSAMLAAAGRAHETDAWITRTRRDHAQP